MNQSNKNSLLTLGLYWLEGLRSRELVAGVVDDCRVGARDLYGARFRTLLDYAEPFHRITGDSNYLTFESQVPVFRLFSAGLQYAIASGHDVFAAYLVEQIPGSERRPYGVVLENCCSSAILVAYDMLSPEVVIDPGPIEQWFSVSEWSKRDGNSSHLSPGKAMCTIGECGSSSRFEKPAT